MKAFDFEYDGILLSDKGLTMCTFGSSGTNTVTNGSQISFNTISTLNGTKSEVVSSEYEGMLTATFQICKDNCGVISQENQYISVEELREIMRWLNRREFLKFRFTDDDYFNIYYEATFNINKIMFGNKIIGLELNMITNRPFGFGEERHITITNATTNGTHVLRDISDEIGYIYPRMVITCNASGDLTIHNSIENRTMQIKNCTSGEVITIEYPLISTNRSAHAIQNDFNWSFFRIANKLNEVINTLTISIACTIDIYYCPIIKMGLM